MCIKMFSPSFGARKLRAEFTVQIMSTLLLMACRVSSSLVSVHTFLVYFLFPAFGLYIIVFYFVCFYCH